MSFDIGDLADSVISPGLQAAATILILKKQKEQYDDIADARQDSIGDAVEHFRHLLRIQMGYNDKIIKHQRSTGKGGGYYYTYEKGSHDDSDDRFKKAFGTKPKAAKFVSIDTAESGASAAEDSLNAVPAAKRFVSASNRIMEQESIVRALIMDGRYLCIEEVTSCTIGQMLNGELPVGDVLEIIKDNAERAAMNGRIGNTHNLTMRDLGISRLRAKMTGVKMHYDHLQSLNQNVHRVGDRVSINDFMQTPAQQLGFALAQAQLIQQSLQNENNIAAAGNPMEMAKLQAKMQEAIVFLGTEAQRGNMINQFVPNYAALLAPAIHTASEALTGAANGSYKTSDATVPQMTAAAPAPPLKASYSAPVQRVGE